MSVHEQVPHAEGDHIHVPVNNIASFSSPMNCIVLRLSPGEEIVSALEQVIIQHNLEAAFIMTCVGSVTNAKLRMADSVTIKNFFGHYEIVSLVGTLSVTGSHLHGSFSDASGKVIGGHIVSDLIVYTTAEIVIGQCTMLKFDRVFDKKSGYKELSVSSK